MIDSNDVYLVALAFAKANGHPGPEEFADSVKNQFDEKPVQEPTSTPATEQIPSA